MSLINDKNEVKSSFFKWGKVGDYIEGTLIGVREMLSNLPGKAGEKVKVYEIKADEGAFHDIDSKKQPVEQPTMIKPGDVWLIGGKKQLDGQMTRIKLGQKVAMKFADEKESKQKGFNALKLIKVYTDGSMDEQWLAEVEPPAIEE